MSIAVRVALDGRIVPLDRMPFDGSGRRDRMRDRFGDLCLERCRRLHLGNGSMRIGRVARVAVGLRRCRGIRSGWCLMFDSIAAFALAMQVAAGSVPTSEVRSLVRDVGASLDGAPLFDREERFWIVQGWHESRWRADALGDGGKACGVVQIHRGMIPPGFGTCDDLRRDRRLGFAAGRALLRGLIERCKGVRPGIGAYFTGKCGGAPKMIAARCHEAGDVC